YIAPKTNRKQSADTDAMSPREPAEGPRFRLIPCAPSDGPVLSTQNVPQGVIAATTVAATMSARLATTNAAPVLPKGGRGEGPPDSSVSTRTSGVVSDNTTMSPMIPMPTRATLAGRGAFASPN